MDDSTSFFEADVFARQTGIELLEVSPGRARVKMEIGEQHMNSHRTVHGGAIFTLADTAFALASNSHGIPAAAINAQISYLTAARSGILYAEAEEFARNPKLASYTVQVTDENGAEDRHLPGHGIPQNASPLIIFFPPHAGRAYERTSLSWWMSIPLSALPPPSP